MFRKVPDTVLHHFSETNVEMSPHLYNLPSKHYESLHFEKINVSCFVF